MIGNIIIKTVDAQVLNPNGSNVFVQNGETPPTAAAKDRSSITDTKARRCQLVLLGASFLTCSLRVGCAHGCVHERAKNRPNVTWYARMICTLFLGLHQNLKYVK